MGAVWWLVLGAIAVVIIVVIINFCCLIRFMDSDDRALWTQIGPKITIVFGLCLVWCAVLLSPYDVATRNAGGSTLDDLWYAVYSMMALVAFCIAPFWCCFYEMGDDYEPNVKKQFIWGCIYVACFIIISGIFMGIFYGALGFVDMTLWQLSSTTSNFTTFADSGDATITDASKVAGIVSVDIKFRTTFFVHVIATTAFVGWIFFTCFGGIGFVALPMDLIRAFIVRPRVSDLQSYHRKKNDLKERAAMLRSLAEELETLKKSSRRYRRDFNKLRSHLYFLEADWKSLQLAKQNRFKSACVAWVKLFLGIFAILWSIVWAIHILLAVLLPKEDKIPMLNMMLVAFDNIIPFLGVAVYSMFVAYLLWIVLHGHLKFGFRVMFVPIHPMKVNETPANSFLFNVMILLVTSVAVVQFLATAFYDYVRLTAGDNIFFQISDLQFFGWWYANNVFIYLMIVVSAISMIYLCIRHNDRSKVNILGAPKKKAEEGAEGEPAEDAAPESGLDKFKNKFGFGGNKGKATDPGPEPAAAGGSGGSDWQDMLNKGKQKVALTMAKQSVKGAFS